MSKVRSGVFSMPKTNPIIQDLLSRLLTVSPESRINVHDIKNHPAFKLFLPPEYVPPCPFSVMPKGPVILKPDEQEFPRILLQMGFSTIDEIQAELASEDDTMAKMFYWMVHMGGSLSRLPWGESSSDSSPELSFTPLMLSDFHATPKLKILSMSDTLSLTESTPWESVDIPNDEVPTESVEFPIMGDVEVLMSNVQKIVSGMGYTYLYPNETEIVCRRTDPLSYYCIYAIFKEDKSILVQIDRFGGFTEELQELNQNIVQSMQSTTTTLETIVE